MTGVPILAASDDYIGAAFHHHLTTTVAARKPAERPRVRHPADPPIRAP